MNKKQIVMIIIIVFMIIIYLLISSKKANDSTSLLEKDVHVVEAFLENAGQVGITFLKSEVDKGKIVEYVYDIPKKLDLSGQGQCEVNQWKIIENEGQNYILVSTGGVTYVYHFPYSVLEKISIKK